MRCRRGDGANPVAQFAFLSKNLLFKHGSDWHGNRQGSPDRVARIHTKIESTGIKGTGRWRVTESYLQLQVKKLKKSFYCEYLP